MFNRLKSRLKNFYVILIAPPKQWRLPKKSEILIYDACGAEVLAPYLAEYSVEVLPLRGESVNVPCLLRAGLKMSFWRSKPLEAYAETFIEAVSPKVVITFIDNNVNFYSISNRFPDIKTIFLQNGTRGELADIFGDFSTSESYHVDYMFVHGAAIGRKYQKFISGKIVEAGSIKNNEIWQSSDISHQSVLFISQYSDRPKNDEPFTMDLDGLPIHFDQFFWAEVQVLKFLNKWCGSNGKKLWICGRGFNEHEQEKKFYTEHLTECMWKYIPRTDSHSSYKSVDCAEIVVFVDSTLGYESIGRGKKTASFSCRGASLNSVATKFGWPADLPENGPFWTNDADEKQFQRVMDYLNTVSAEEWEQARQPYANELMRFDPGNTRFIALLNQLLPKSESLNNV